MQVFRVVMATLVAAILTVYIEGASTFDVTTIEDALERAMQLHKNGDGAMAIALLQQVSAQVPDNTDVLMAVGALQHTYGLFQEAIAIYKHIIHINPGR
jgi:hypothetical protein